VDFIQTPAKALGFTISPTLGAEKADGNIEQVSHLYENTLIHTLLLYIPAGVGIIIIAEPFIEVIFGPKYNGTVPVLQVFGLYTILLSVTRITSWGLDYLGRARSRAIAKGVTSILNVILNIILIPTMGLIGAPIATVVTHSLFTLANLYIIQQEFELRMPYILKNISLISLVTIIMAASIYPIRHLTDDVFTLVSTVLIGVLIWAILSSAMGIFDIQKVKSMLL
jgi:O-antigen/teichoic acid export membrane protein